MDAMNTLLHIEKQKIKIGENLAMKRINLLEECLK
jgi:hypothetical protein